MQTDQNQIKAAWHESYTSVWQTIFADEVLSKEPRQPLFRWRDDIPAERCAQIRGVSDHKIEIATAFALEMESELVELAQTITSYAPLRRRSFPKDLDTTLSFTSEVVRRFTLLHELFHLLCGHIEWLHEHKKGSNAAFDELNLGMFSPGESILGSSPNDDVSRAYMFEAEADGLAIQWLTRTSMFPAKGRFPGKAGGMLNRLPKRPRILAFRLLLGAIWIVVRKMERNRLRSLKGPSETHPLPGARAILAISMLAREYAGIYEVEIDEHGGAHRRLTARESHRLRVFFPEIVRPVLGADWWPEVPNIPRKSLEGGLPELLPALQSYLLRQEPRDPFGVQIRRIEEMRLRLDKELARYRYLPLPSLSEGVHMETATFELSATADTPLAEVEQLLRAELKKRGFEMTSFEEEESLGMTGAEVVIGIAISFGSSVAANLLQEQIEAAVAAVGSALKAALHVIKSI